MNKYCPALAVTAVWLVLAFLMIEHSLYWFGWEYTAWALVASGGMVWGGVKLTKIFPQ